MKSYVECPNCNATHLLMVKERLSHTEALFCCSHCSCEWWVTFAIKDIELVKD